MERRDARQFQQVAGTHESGWNIVELDARRQLRQQINKLIRLTNDTPISSNTMRQQLHLGVATFGNRFATQLVRSLHRDDQHERQAITWLLTLLDDKATIPLLEQMKLNEQLPRSVRLSAALALAGMGATAETAPDYQRMETCFRKCSQM